MIFSHLCVDEPRYFGAPLVGRALFCPRLTAASMTSAEGALDDRIANALVAERLLVRDDTGRLFAPHRTTFSMEQMLSIVEILGHTWGDMELLTKPPIVIMVGTLDVAWILGQLGPNTDFILDDPRFDECAFAERADVKFVPAALVRTLIRERLANVAKALQLLVELGFENVFVHSVAPPTPNDARYFRCRRIQTQASVRSKTTIAFNTELAAAARASGVGFLDMWDATAEGGTLAPKFALDGDHFNRAAALLTIERLLDETIDRAAEPAPLAEHTMLATYVPRDLTR